MKKELSVKGAAMEKKVALVTGAKMCIRDSLKPCVYKLWEHLMSATAYFL